MPSSIDGFHGARILYDTKEYFESHKIYLGLKENGANSPLSQDQSQFTPAIQGENFNFSFYNFFHPYVGELIQELNSESLAGLLNPDFHQKLEKFFFDELYLASSRDWVTIKSFPKEIDLGEHGPYSNYNWELLFHVPLTIAVHLSKNQRFAEAQRWFHYIFDPTSNDTSVPTPQRFWKFLRFRKMAGNQQIDDQLTVLSNPNADPEQVNNTISGYEAIKDKPFQPHAVARTRHISYQYSVVMKYLDNLIAWGDSLFRQDTMESINEATQLYVLAANLLGPRPQRVPPRGTARPQTFARLKKEGRLDSTGNALVDLEGKFPFNLGLPRTQETPSETTASLFGIGRTLYFCIPHNDKLLSYWDTVSDRLFKIRHCMNITGIVRQLALFDPPLDPGMLVKAAAAGLDVSAMVSGLNQPTSQVRAPLLMQKALELCAEVRGLGSALLSAIEKGEGERLLLLRQSHEIKIQQMQQDVRFLQWKQAQESTESLLRSRASALERYSYYLRLLGLTPDRNLVPETFSLNRRELSEANFDDVYTALVEQYEKTVPHQSYLPLRLAGESSPSSQSGGSGSGKLSLNTGENAELNVHLPNAKENRATAFVARQIAPVFSLIPDFPINLHFWGLGGTIIIGGSSLTKNVQTGADVLDLMTSRENDDATTASKTASYERRSDEWMLQSNLAARELIQIGRQIISSLIAEQVNYREYLNTKNQIENSQEVDRFLREKFTNEELYGWMQGEISRLYYEYYRFAFDTARKAEQTMKQELMRPEVDATDYIKFNYWDAGRKGLLSGEALYLDLKRMELAYHENNKREYELTKHVSLLQVNPIALLQLRTTGSCTVSLPEDVFDMDCPGHYLRRIKNIAVSIPCVTGPYTSINCTLTLLKSSIRIKPELSDDRYERTGTEDIRFRDYYGSLQSIVTSNGQNDSGLFETNLRDERYLPFEGSGVISEWRLSLPTNPSKGEPCQFDYNTISDVILHFRYTAREAGGALRNGAIANLTKQIEVSQAVGSVRLFSVRHEFPTAWAKFKSDAELTLDIQEEHFPYWSKGRLGSIKKTAFYVQSSTGVSPQPSASSEVQLITHYQNGAADTTETLDPRASIPLADPPNKFTLRLKSNFNNSPIDDLWLALTWGKGGGS